MHGSALPSSDGSLSSPSGSFSFGTPYFYQRGATAVGTPAVGSSFSIVNPLAVWQHSASGDRVSDSPSDQTAVVSSSGVRRLSLGHVAESVIGSELSAVNSIAAAVGGDSESGTDAACSFSSVYASSTASDLSSESDSPGPVAPGNNNPFAPVVQSLGFNPFVSDFECDLGLWSAVAAMSSKSFDFVYDGVKVGLQAESHLQRFERFRRTLPVPGNCPLLRLQAELTWFADSAVPFSRFDQWQQRIMQPLLQQIDQQLQVAMSQPARVNAAANLTLLWDAAKADFRATFCKATPDELQEVCNSVRVESGLDGLRGLVIKLQTLYALRDISAVPSEGVAVRRLLTLMQDEAGLAGTAAKVSAGLHALPAQGAYTFANVAAQLENIAVEKDQDSAASMLSLNGRARGSARYLKLPCCPNLCHCLVLLQWPTWVI